MAIGVVGYWEIRNTGDPRCIRFVDRILAQDDDHWLAPASLHLGSCTSDISVAKQLGHQLPIAVLDIDPAMTMAITTTDLLITSTADLIGTIVACLGRYEELCGGTRDAHERFTAHASLMAKANQQARPIADEAVAVIRCMISHWWPDQLGDIPTAHLIPTHDLDHPLFGMSAERTHWPRLAMGDLLARHSPRLCLKRVLTGLGVSRVADPYDTIDALIAADEILADPGIYFVMAPAIPHALDGTCPISHPGLRTQLERVQCRGHLIGLHPAYLSASNPTEMARERSAAETAIGVAQGSMTRARLHYLRWLGPDSWQALASAGIREDHSIGWHDAIGFRAGTCHPYRACDLRNGTILDLTIIPLLAMDTTLFHKQYLGLNPGSAWDAVIPYLCALRRHGGRASILWHNTTMLDPAWSKLYTQICTEWASPQASLIA